MLLISSVVSLVDVRYPNPYQPSTVQPDSLPVERGTHSSQNRQTHKTQKNDVRGEFTLQLLLSPSENKVEIADGDK